jgi:hypothetical protein
MNFQAFENSFHESSRTYHPFLCGSVVKCIQRGFEDVSCLMLFSYEYRILNDFMSILQYFIPETVLTQKYHMKLCPILSDYVDNGT